MGYGSMDAYQTEYWDRILPYPFAYAVRGEAIDDFGFIVFHGSPWSLETW